VKKQGSPPSLLPCAPNKEKEESLDPGGYAKKKKKRNGNSEKDVLCTPGIDRRAGEKGGGEKEPARHFLLYTGGEGEGWAGEKVLFALAALGQHPGGKGRSGQVTIPREEHGTWEPPRQSFGERGRLGKTGFLEKKKCRHARYLFHKGKGKGQSSSGQSGRLEEEKWLVSIGLGLPKEREKGTVADAAHNSSHQHGGGTLEKGAQDYCQREGWVQIRELARKGNNLPSRAASVFRGRGKKGGRRCLGRQT